MREVIDYFYTFSYLVFQKVPDNNDSSKPAMTLGNVFSLQHLKNSFKVLFLNRPDGSRHFICILVLLFGMYSFASNASHNINISFVQESFEWDSQDSFKLWYSKYSSTEQALVLVAIGVILPIFTKVLKLNDLVITTFGLISYVVGLCTIMLAQEVNVLFVASAFNMFSNLTTTTIRSALSKIICTTDIGKVIISALGFIHK